jgi:hypothetical protein
MLDQPKLAVRTNCSESGIAARSLRIMVIAAHSFAFRQHCSARFAMIAISLVLTASTPLAARHY